MVILISTCRSVILHIFLFSLGWGLLHGVFSIIVAYVILQFCGSGIAMVISMFLFNMVSNNCYIQYTQLLLDIKYTE